MGVEGERRPGGMAVIPARVLRRVSRERGLALDVVEKDYLIGWILFCISETKLSESLALKGGTALSKVYFPLEWRVSEDLDFTLLVGDTSAVAAGLSEVLTVGEEQLPEANLRFREEPYSNPEFVRARLQYSGPVSPNNVRIEIMLERFVGAAREVEVPRPYEDWPVFRVTTYSLETILAEKMRSLLERTRVRDWYDVWRLSGEVEDREEVKRLFLRKVEGKGVVFSGIGDFFPTSLREELEPYWEVGLARLASEKLPPVSQVLIETEDRLRVLLSDGRS